MKPYLQLLLGILFSFSLRSQAQTEATAAVLLIPNEGQWQQNFLYKGVATGVDFYLEKEGITYVTGAAANSELLEAYKEGKTTEAPLLNFHAYKMKWIGANKNAVVKADKKQSFYYNYFIGNDTDRWKSNVPLYANATYENLYPHIDFYLYSENNQPKYDIIVKPNGNVDNIKLQYEGTDGLRLEKRNLIIKTSVGEIIESKPYAYQYINGERKEVKCDYQISGNTVSFSFPKSYNKAETLVIDPQLVFASLTGSVADNWGFSATYDKAGNLYAGGIVRSAGYPVSTGAFQITYGGGNNSPSTGIDCDISISKFNAQGTALVYSTYLGGSGNEMPHSLVVDNNNNLIISGKSTSSNYPHTTSAFDTVHNGGFDIIITKFNSTGTALLGSTYVGGSGDDGVNISPVYAVMSGLKYNYGDDSRSEVLVDAAGNIYLASNTQSSNFPVTANALKNTRGGPQDGVLLKFNPTLSTMIYGTYIGGSDYDGAYSLALDTSGTKIYVSGGTSSNDFHSSSMSGAYQSTYGGNIDGYIMRFENGGNYPLLKSTYVGTVAYDQNFGVQTDLENGVYVMGQTLGNFPVSPGVYSNAGGKQYIMKIDSTLSTRIYSTVFGSPNATHVNISPVAFLVDTCQNVYISGWGGLTTVAGVSSSTTGMPTTPNAIQSTTDGKDFYFIALNKNALSLLYGTFFGSPNKEEHVDGGTSRFDPNGVVYQAICASCGNGSAFPATPGAWASTKGSTNCNLGAVKIAFNLGSVSTHATASPSATGCVPFTVNFNDSSVNATSWSWDFGNGASSTQQTPTYTYTTPGVYQVRLIAYNPDACKTRDTSYVTITVRADTISPNFDINVLDSCEAQKVQLINTSQGINGGPITGATFHWDFGDGFTYTGTNPPVHDYSSIGSYTIKLTMILTGACNSPDSISKEIDFNNLFVKVEQQPNQTLCAGETATFLADAHNATSYQWQFGDGDQSNLPNPDHTYTTPGTYTLTLVAGNPNTCNKWDTTISTIIVNPIPSSQFSYTPIVSETNQPFNFINQSTDATAYSWDFGDGMTSTETNPSYTYVRSGTYNVCLTAINEFGCKDISCKSVIATILPLADVPSAFSPNGDGNNDLLKVRGFGIEKMNLKIYNRWGELVFETINQDEGWDGTFKGQPQEMEVYGFLLTVDFYDGTSTKKKGNITLIR